MNKSKKSHKPAKLAKSYKMKTPKLAKPVPRSAHRAKSQDLLPVVEWK